MKLFPLHFGVDLPHERYEHTTRTAAQTAVFPGT